MSTVRIEEVRDRLGELIQRLKAGEEVVITEVEGVPIVSADVALDRCGVTRLW